MSTANAPVDGIPIVTEYFGDDTARPEIAQQFIPGSGWIDNPDHPQISRSHARQLRRAGVLAVALEYDGRTADFHTDELIAGTAPTKHLIR